MNSTWLAFTIALAAALALTPVARRLALRVGCLDPVVARSMHREPKPYLGGLAIYAAFAAAVLATLRPLDRPVLGILICGGLVCAIGLVDDFLRPRGIPARIKFALQALAALALVVIFDVRIDWIQNPLGSGYLSFGPWAVPLTVFWLVGFTNVVNLIDGLDGLAAGISSIGALTLLVVALRQGQVAAMVLTAALAGAALGFLRYNFNPAQIFMGDAGAMFLGFTLGAVAVHGVLKGAAAVGVAVPLIALGVPILDTAFAIVRRLASGRSIGEPDRDHLHHRLLRMGLSHRAAVLALWAISGWLGLAAVAATGLAAQEGALVLAAVLAMTVYGAVRLGLLQVTDRRNLQQ